MAGAASGGNGGVISHMVDHIGMKNIQRSYKYRWLSRRDSGSESRVRTNGFACFEAFSPTWHGEPGNGFLCVPLGYWNCWICLAEGCVARHPQQPAVLMCLAIATQDLAGLSDGIRKVQHLARALAEET